MRALVIGAGPTTQHEHLPVLARLRDAGKLVLAVICDLDRSRSSAAHVKFGFLEESGDAHGALRRPDIDIVYIFGSAQLHYQYGLQALQNGKHLFVEKPVAPGFAQAMTLAHTARERGLIAVGGLNRRFFSSLTRVREQGGKAGWRSAEAVFHKAEFGNRPSFGAETWLGANGIHALDALLFVMGGIPDHLASHTDRVDGVVAAPSIFSALMRWRNGAQGIFLCNNAAGSRREEYVFHGHGETYRVDGGGLTVERGGTSSTLAMPSIGDGFAAEHAAFLLAIHSRVQPLHSLAAIAPTLFVAELIEAGFTGQVEMPTPEPQPAVEPAPFAGGNKSILVSHSIELQTGLARLLPQYALLTPEDVLNSSTSRPDIKAAILGRGSGPLTPQLLDRLPQLRIVGVMGLSLSRHDPALLLERGIAIINASEAYADSVAEFALALAILARRRAFGSHANMRRGGWGTHAAAGSKGMLLRAAEAVRPAARAVGLESSLLNLWRKTDTAKKRRSSASSNVSRDLQGAVIGLLGWGENARVFAELLRRHKARVLVYSEHAAVQDIVQTRAAPASLADVLTADIVSLHRGLTSNTRHFLGASELAKLRPGAVLINTARGGLIDPDALLARLLQGDIFACLDTFEDEPLPASHALRSLPNVFLTSHIAGGSKDMHAAAADEVIRKVIAFLEGEDMRSISSERLSTMT